MMSRRVVLPLILLSLCAFARVAAAADALPPTDALKSLALLKTLEGDWTGPITVDNPAWATDKPAYIAMRVVSQGNALAHEYKETQLPAELTVFYVDRDQLNLLHYCDFANRPRLIARPSKDGKSVEFDLVEYSGSDVVGHVSHAVFTVVDASHHTEEWTFLMPGDKAVHARMDLKRVQP
jgi:hypothetical protein